jgi:Ran GTPase-activating protein (RanGAP) involved in mRNA processing and transport
LTAKGIAPITDALLNDTQVKALWLKRNPLKADGMVPIGNLLRFNSTIQVLDLLNCGLLDSGVAVLFEAMKENKGLRHLYLSANGITPAGLESIKSFYSTGKSQLQTLFLGCNRICNEGAKIIADCLNYDKELLTLNLPSSRIGAEGMKHLAEALIKHDRIRVLELGYMRATLDLGELGNFIEDEGAEHLARYIEKSKNLLSLSITHNHITEKGMAAIKRAVKVNESLVSLDYVQYGVPVSEVVLEDLKRTLDNNRKQYELKKIDIESILIPEHVREIYSVYRTH